jgi:DNA adenine methylase
MILTRLGNKRRIAQDIIKYFPEHRTFIDMFFGAGGLFFSKPLSDYNFCNDIDDDVFNLYMALQEQKEQLINQIEIMPITETLLKHWKHNKETEPLKKAVRFLMLSNFGYMGKPDTLVFGQDYGNMKKVILENIEATLKKLKFVHFMNCDFREVLPKIKFRDNESDAFVYADPPYLNTGNNYQDSFTESDTIDLFQILANSGLRFAISEFDNDFVLGLANDYKLNIITIGERQNMKNRRTEILVTNYKKPLSLFDGV